jgi:hypothetical protein
MRIEENIRARMPPKEAQHAARIGLGGSEQVKEQVREVRMGNWLYSVVFDCRYGARQLRKNPGFAAVAMVTLAIAIGANAVVFSALKGFLLRQLNLPQSESLYGLQFGEGARGARSYPRQLRAIRSYWTLLCWPCDCWGCWLRGFRRGARCPSIPQSCSARSGSALSQESLGYCFVLNSRFIESSDSIRIPDSARRYRVRSTLARNVPPR